LQIGKLRVRVALDPVLQSDLDHALPRRDFADGVLDVFQVVRGETSICHVASVKMALTQEKSVAASAVADN
jgi:hypothetical protein